MFNNVYKEKSVFVTGHTGFKGSWLSLWLSEMGAKVSGFALPTRTPDDHWNLLQLDAEEKHADIRDKESLSAALNASGAEIVFHLAAQPLVRQSYADPLETWSVNVIGTATLLEACRNCKTLKAIVVITTDKVYDNKEWSWGYRESDHLGGYDPYSASKAATELTVQSYRKSFFSGEGIPLLASVRAGNVIGGGDWSNDRLIPDVVRSINKGNALIIRSPFATRPWQHVLDCLSGYLLLGQYLLENKTAYAQAWNFGPASSDNRKVIDVLNMLKKNWEEIDWKVLDQKKQQLHEAGMLYLDSAMAHDQLGWEPVWTLESALRYTALWYRNWHEKQVVVSRQQLKEYILEAEKKQASWMRS